MVGCGGTDSTVSHGRAGVMRGEGGTGRKEGRKGRKERGREEEREILGLTQLLQTSLL